MARRSILCSKRSMATTIFRDNQRATLLTGGVLVVAATTAWVFKKPTETRKEETKLSVSELREGWDAFATKSVSMTEDDDDDDEEDKDEDENEDDEEDEDEDDNEAPDDPYSHDIETEHDKLVRAMETRPMPK